MPQTDRTLDPAPPWDQPTEGETPRAFSAFTVYRDLGPDRSLARAAEAFYRGRTAAKVRQLETWSSRHRWRDRVAAYDRWLDAQLVARRREEHLAMAERHASTARSTLDLVAGQLVALVKLEEKRLAAIEEADPADLDPALLKPVVPATSLARLLDVGVRVERLSAGLATDLVGEADVEELTDEELERILEGGAGDDDEAS